jgi:hypothetical protein
VDGLGLYNVGLGRWGSGGVGGPVGLYVRGPTRVLGGGPAADLCREPRQPGSRQRALFAESLALGTEFFSKKILK